MVWSIVTVVIMTFLRLRQISVIERFCFHIFYCIFMFRFRSRSLTVVLCDTGTSLFSYYLDKCYFVLAIIVIVFSTSLVYVSDKNVSISSLWVFKYYIFDLCTYDCFLYQPSTSINFPYQPFRYHFCDFLPVLTI